MQDPICPFSATLARVKWNCVHAREIVRRGGVEFACNSESAMRNVHNCFSS